MYLSLSLSPSLSLPLSFSPFRCVHACVRACVRVCVHVVCACVRQVYNGFLLPSLSASNGGPCTVRLHHRHTHTHARARTHTERERERTRKTEKQRKRETGGKSPHTIGDQRDCCAIVLSCSQHCGTPRFTVQRLTATYDKIAEVGFKPEYIEAAMTAAGGVILSDIFDWLCLHVPHDDVPDGFTDKA